MLLTMIFIVVDVVWQILVARNLLAIHAANAAHPLVGIVQHHYNTHMKSGCEHYITCTHTIDDVLPSNLTH
jgi:hypothetical protein